VCAALPGAEPGWYRLLLDSTCPDAVSRRPRWDGEEERPLPGIFLEISGRRRARAGRSSRPRAPADRSRRPDGAALASSRTRGVEPSRLRAGRGARGLRTPDRISDFGVDRKGASTRSFSATRRGRSADSGARGRTKRVARTCARREHGDASRRADADVPPFRSGSSSATTGPRAPGRWELRAPYRFACGASSGGRSPSDRNYLTSSAGRRSKASGAGRGDARNVRVPIAVTVEGDRLAVVEQRRRVSFHLGGDRRFCARSPIQAGFARRASSEYSAGHVRRARFLVPTVRRGADHRRRSGNPLMPARSASDLSRRICCPMLFAHAVRALRFDESRRQSTS